LALTAVILDRCGHPDFGFLRRILAVNRADEESYGVLALADLPSVNKMFL